MKRTIILSVLLVLAVVVLAVTPFVGMESIPLGTLWSQTDDAKLDILWKIRLPRVAMAFLAGSALATSGMAFQAMFRNPLATPFTLGVSSGARSARRSAFTWASRFNCWASPRSPGSPLPGPWWRSDWSTG